MESQVPKTFIDWLSTQGPAIFLLGLFVWGLLAKRLALYYQLVEMKQSYEDQIADVRKGHAERCDDYEKRLARKDQEALEWRNLALRLGMTAAKSTSLAEKAVTLAEKPTLTE